MQTISLLLPSRVNNGTKVTIIVRNIPPGIRPEDNETGTQLTLEKLTRYAERNEK